MIHGIALWLFLTDAEELLDDHIVDAAEVNYAQNCVAYEEASFTQATYVTDPVDDVVDLAVNYG